jgi:hypothetical protein
MLEFQSGVIHRISDSEGETRGYYRFLNNDKVTEDELINGLQQQCMDNLKTERVLVFSDSCTINLAKRYDRIEDKEGLYNIGQNRFDKEVFGFIIHPLLVYDRDNGTPRGVANVKTIERPVKGNKRPPGWDRKSCTIEEKENYKWISTVINVRDTVLSKPKHKLFVMDREADVIDVFDNLTTETSDVLIRSNYNRIVIDEQKNRCKIDDLLARQDKLGTIEVKIKGKKRKNRKAILSIKIAQVTLPWPPYRKVKKKIHTEGVKVSIIKVSELEHKGYENEPPLEWTLITTERIENIEDALEIVDCYSQRWRIEMFFKLMKTDGFNIEGTELTKGKNIRKLTLLIMKSSIKVLQLKAARTGEGDAKVIEVFTEQEIECLSTLNIKLNGSTIKQQNPYRSDTLSWATWIVARLGGWKEFYNKERPPGNKTLAWGLERFEAIMIGYNISIKKDVS